jgi:uncharacterized protein with FMN-binding domain
MKKIALSLLLIAASGAYVWNQAGARPGNDLLGTTTLSSDAGAGSLVLPDALPAPKQMQTTTPAASVVSVEPAPAPPAVVPLPRPQTRLPPATITRAAMTLAANSAYADGTYTGPAVDAYYGLIQIQAIVAGGRLNGIKVLQYPSDRRTSVNINRQALPMLRDEVVSAQSANVDIVTGATLTSEAFIRSIGGALQQARQ